MVAVPSALEQVVKDDPRLVLAVMGLFEARTTLAKAMLTIKPTGPVRQSIEVDFGDAATAQRAAGVITEHFEVEKAKPPPGYYARNIVRVIGTGVRIETEVGS